MMKDTLSNMQARQLDCHSFLTDKEAGYCTPIRDRDMAPDPRWWEQHRELDWCYNVDKRNQRRHGWHNYITPPR